MSRSWAFSAFLLLLLPARAQDTLMTVPGVRFYAAHDHILIAEASADYNANSIRNELVAGLWKGGFIDRDLRERSRDALRERNSVGYVLSARVSYIGPGTGKWRQLTSVSHQEHMGVRFPRDLYNLTFFGNANYEGRRADLGPAAFTRTQYQTIGFGAQRVDLGHYFRVDLVLGQSIDAVNLKWAGLYTGVDGRVLRASVLGDHWRSDTASSSFGQLNGLGLAVSGRWGMRISRHNQARVDFEVQDLGFVGWGRKSLHLHKDTILEYTGLRVASILDLDNVLIGEDQLLDTFGLRYTQDPFTKPLPFLLRATLSAPLGVGWSGSVQVDQRYLPGYIPQLTFGALRSLGARGLAVAGGQLSMGGFGGIRLGASAQRRFGERVVVMLSSPHLPGFLLGGTRGAGLAFSVTVGI
ncbi:MAG: hypothetical protein IPI81_07625 [Flavobacteriales bacterium]|nr:hypothetical protein [Flavobacteriales bacterium]MCC6938097.1 hypothetical protein [Flavobacteriales bacterium]